MRALLLIALLVAGCSKPAVPATLFQQPAGPGFTGPDSTEVPLLRTTEGGSRIYVQATLPDGQPGLFLVDTGAAISALSESTAERLGLPIERGFSYVEGLGGRAPLDRAVIETLALGDAVVPAVDVAVGIRGLPEYAGAMPLDGILGTNVWSRFTVEIDYPQDTLRLHRPGTEDFPRRFAPMFFDSGHVFTPLTITTDADTEHTDQVIIQVDTGAGGLLLAGSTGKPFEEDYTEGIEPVLGLGAPEALPASEFLRRTRRIPIKSVELGAKKVPVGLEARWINYERGGPLVGPMGMRGLAGHELLEEHVTWFDFRGGRFALARSSGKPTLSNGHATLLEQDLAAHGQSAPARGLHRARLFVALERLDEARKALQSYLAWTEAEPETSAEARVMLAAVHRFDGDLAAAWDVLAPLEPGELVDHGELEASVNGLLLEGRIDEATALALGAIDQRPDKWSSWRALSDIHYAEGDFVDARDALLKSARLAGNPDAHLVRRARVALASGDNHGAMAHLRRLLDLYPQSGMYLWFYSQLPESEASRETFLADLSQTIDRLHPGDRPLDFVVASHTAMGNQDLAERVMRQGISRDCETMPEAPLRDNCTAWYYALAGVEPQGALSLIEGALAETGDRADFLDTKAMVHLARGEMEEAQTAARAAARLSPDDIYMLWQADRIAALAGRPDTGDIEGP